MSDFEKKGIKSREIERLQSDSEIGEKVDFAFLIWKHVDNIQRTKLLSFYLNDNFVSYFIAVESLRDLLSGVADSDFKKKMSELDSRYDVVLKESREYNEKLIKDWDGDPVGRVKSPNYHDFGRLFFNECIPFIQRKGLGLTEIQTDSFE